MTQTGWLRTIYMHTAPVKCSKLADFKLSTGTWLLSNAPNWPTPNHLHAHGFCQMLPTGWLQIIYRHMISVKCSVLFPFPSPFLILISPFPPPPFLSSRPDLFFHSNMQQATHTLSGVSNICSRFTTPGWCRFCNTSNTQAEENNLHYSKQKAC